MPMLQVKICCSARIICLLVMLTCCLFQRLEMKFWVNAWLHYILALSTIGVPMKLMLFPQLAYAVMKGNTIMLGASMEDMLQKSLKSQRHAQKISMKTCASIIILPFGMMKAIGIGIVSIFLLPLF